MSNSLTHIWQALRLWLSGPLGHVLLETEAAIVSEMVRMVFGHHLLVLGEPQFLSCVLQSPMLHRVWIHPMMADITEGNRLQARQDQLPIRSDEVDLVFLAHCLESAQNPHESLRESYRVLKSSGHVIITGFNPWSMWGLWNGVLRYFKQIPWGGHFISVSRLKDWLALLGFDILCVQRGLFRPPLSNRVVLHRLRWLEWVGQWFWPFWGGCYVIFAQKRLVTLTAVRPVRMMGGHLVPTGFAETATRVKREPIVSLRDVYLRIALNLKYKLRAMCDKSG